MDSGSRASIGSPPLPVASPRSEGCGRSCREAHCAVLSWDDGRDELMAVSCSGLTPELAE